MKRWLRVIIISVFATAAVGLVILQFVQMRRTFSISDNMFNVSVNNAMDEVISQMNSEGIGPEMAGGFNYQELDSLVAGELLINGIDIEPSLGIYDGSQGSFLYSSDPGNEEALERSPYRYMFRPAGVVSANQYYIILGFSPTDLFLLRNTSAYSYMNVFLIAVIAIMFLLSIRAMANQRRLDQMKNEFINNMTHEIKTPISTIGLACEMLSDESISQDTASRGNFINIIADENQRMRLLVETILQSAKMSGKNFHINPKPVDVNALVERVLASFRLTLANRGGTAETQLEASPSVIEADELHLTNLIYNLVDNGIKYSPKAPRITIGTALQGDHLLLRVSDEGMGISKADQKHVFDKFYRVSTGDVHNVKGFGIGLSYVAQVVRLHHGHITVESEPGKGSTFTVSLPVKG